MNPILSKTNFKDDFSLPSKKSREINNLRFKKLFEEKGSYDGQYGEADKIAKLLLKNNYGDGKPSIVTLNGYEYRLIFDRVEQAPSRGCVNGNVVTIIVNPEFVQYQDVAKTISHEIMHLFQSKLDKIDGISENSMFLYHYLLSFANATTLMFSSNFFYALYYVFSIERKANVSSISNFLKGKFGNRKPSTDEITTALEDCDSYMAYVDFLNYFNVAKPTKKDKEYITYCMTRVLKNPYTDEFGSIYNPQKFNVDKLIKNNVEQILRYCQDTIDKMKKNIMIFLEND